MTEFKIVISGYDVMTTEVATKLIAEKLTQLKIKFKQPVFFPNKRVVVSVPSSPHKHKDAQEKYKQITHQRKFFVAAPDNLAPSKLENLLNTELPGEVNLRFVISSKKDKRKSFSKL